MTNIWYHILCGARRGSTEIHGSSRRTPRPDRTGSGLNALYTRRPVAGHVGGACRLDRLRVRRSVAFGAAQPAGDRGYRVVLPPVLGHAMVLLCGQIGERAMRRPRDVLIVFTSGLSVKKHPEGDLLAEAAIEMRGAGQARATASMMIGEGRERSLYPGPEILRRMGGRSRSSSAAAAPCQTTWRLTRRRRGLHLQRGTRRYTHREV
ncbi:hypothetical protein SAMN05519103_01792 [Rhizobiales bacterium GAS113]|nr:hypothetical protein SAMN05519103_01792 [Rhizobiales bacterium GAS113]